MSGKRDKLLIIGAGGHGRVAADIALKMRAWHEIIFADDRKINTSVMGLKVVCSSNNVQPYIDKADIFVAIGDNKTRSSIQKQLKAKGANFPVLIHPNTSIGLGTELGEGSVVMAGAVINCHSKIGESSIVNTGATIDHDNIIGDYVHISPGAHLAGTVSIGDFTWIGIGGIVSSNLSIIENSIIGSGAVVIQNIEESGTYVGVPARRIK